MLSYYRLCVIRPINGTDFDVDRCLMPLCRYLSKADAVAVFLKSGLDKTVLRSIWFMADVDADGQLTRREFSVAFHMILCVRCVARVCELLLCLIAVDRLFGSVCRSCRCL